MSPAQAGTRFDDFFNETYQEVRAFARRRVRDANVIDDVVSEAFLVAWRRFDEIPTNRAAALPWLYRVVAYVASNSQRGVHRRRALIGRLELDTIRPPVTSLDDEFDELARAFSSLSVGDRSILLLAGWEGLDGAQIGLMLGCSPSSATTRLSRARSRFRQAVEAQDNSLSEWELE